MLSNQNQPSQRRRRSVQQVKDHRAACLTGAADGRSTPRQRGAIQAALDLDHVG